MFEAGGVKNITTWDSPVYAIGQGVHEMGTARAASFAVEELKKRNI